MTFPTTLWDALDSTTIDLCLSLFPWAKFRKRKTTVKLHTLLDLRGNIPMVLHVTSDKVHDVKILDDIPPEPGVMYEMDRGYVDFARLYRLRQASAFFVTRAKRNFTFTCLHSHPVDKSVGVQCDQIIRIRGFYGQRDYPKTLRRIRYVGPDTIKRLVFLTNNFTLPVLTKAHQGGYITVNRREIIVLRSS